MQSSKLNLRLTARSALVAFLLFGLSACAISGDVANPACLFHCYGAADAKPLTVAPYTKGKY